MPRRHYTAQEINKVYNYFLENEERLVGLPHNLEALDELANELNRSPQSVFGIAVRRVQGNFRQVPRPVELCLRRLFGIQSRVGTRWTTSQLRRRERMLNRRRGRAEGNEEEAPPQAEEDPISDVDAPVVNEEVPMSDVDAPMSAVEETVSAVEDPMSDVEEPMSAVESEEEEDGSIEVSRGGHDSDHGGTEEGEDPLQIDDLIAPPRHRLSRSSRLRRTQAHLVLNERGVRAQESLEDENRPPKARRSRSDSPVAVGEQCMDDHRREGRRSFSAQNFYNAPSYWVDN